MIDERSSSYHKSVLTGGGIIVNPSVQPTPALVSVSVSNPAHEAVIMPTTRFSVDAIDVQLCVAPKKDRSRFVEPLDIRFKNVVVTAPDDSKKNGRMEILHGISGVIPGGEMLALMGATGSGKSTLLSALSNRLEGGAQVESCSQIRYGRYSFSKAFKRRIGFVEQDDVVTPELTVVQALVYQARLRIDDTTENQQKRVDEVIAQLRLTKCANTRIGDALDRGISGGERKRLCIGSELLTKPQILFLDEPTSGLDSSTAVLVTELLHGLAAEGITVVSSIHQPSSQVFGKFSNLCLLHAGQIIYFGSAGKDSVDYFAKYGYKCPALYNPPDYFMELTVDGELEKDQETLNKMHAEFCPETVEISEHTESLIESTKTRYAVSYLTQLQILSERSFHRVRKQAFTTSEFILMIGLAIVDGLCFMNLGTEDRNVSSRVGLGLWILGNFMFFPIIKSLAVFSSDRVVVRKELYVGAYRLSAYYLSRVLTLLPSEMFFSWLFTTILYFMAVANSSSVEQYFYTIFIVWLAMTTFYALGLFVAAAVPERHVLTVCIILITFSFLYSGFFVPFENMPSWIRWTEHINLFMYCFNLFMNAILHSGPEFTCTSGTDTFIDECRSGQDNNTLTAQEILDFYGFDKDPHFCIGVLVGAFFVLHFAGYRFLRHSYR